MIPRLLPADTTNFNTAGISLTDTISCTVTEERNGVFTLEMVVATTTPYFDQIKEGMLIVVKPNHTQTLQAFEICKISRPILQRVTILANHISYKQSFIPVEPFSCTGITATLQGLVNYSLETNPFTFITDITNETSTYNQIEPASLRSRLGGTEGSVLDVFGGEYLWNNYETQLLLHRGSDNGVELRVGKNITDLEQTTELDSVVTGALPYWYDEDENQHFYGDIQYNTDVSKYAYHRTVVLDLSEEFETAPTVNQLNAAAREYIDQVNLGLPTTNIKVSYVDLADTEEYKDSILERTNLCDTVNVIYTPLNISYKAKVIKLVFDVLAERTLSVEVGEARSTISKTITDLVGDVSSVIKTGKRLVSVTQSINRELGEVRTTVASVQQTVDGSLNHITYLYAYGDSATSKPSDSAFTYSTMPPLVDGKYIWRMSLAYTNENPSSNPTKTYEMIQGATGQTGSQGAKGDKGDKGEQGIQGETGAKGDSGNGISSITYYYKTTTTQSQPSASSITATTIPIMSETNKYLWQKEVIKYTDIADKVTVSLLAVYGDKGLQGEQGAKGDKGDQGIQGETGAKGDKGDKGDTGATGNGISAITYYYKATTNQTAPSASSVTSTSIPTLSETNKYLWQKQHIVYTDGNTKDTVALIGVYGDKGDDGVSVTQIDNLYYLKDALLDISLNGNTTQGENPSPSSPQAIHNVTGDNEIRVTGKNLAPSNAQAQTIYGITFTPNEDGSIKAKGTATGGFSYSIYGTISAEKGIPLVGGQTYTFSGAHFQLNGTTAIAAMETPKTRQAVDGDYISYIWLYYGSGVTVDKTYYPQLELGSTVTTYEPYKAQIYPITLPVENLAENKLTPQTVNGLSINVSGGIVTINGTATASKWFRICKKTLAQYGLSVGDTVTLSGCPTGGSDNWRVGVSMHDSSGGDVRLVYDTGNGVTFTIPSDANDIEILIYVRNGTTINNLEFKPQLERGTHANTYNPYGAEYIELNALGNYKDYFYKNDGKWYLHKAIDKVDMGTLTWGVGASSDSSKRTMQSTGIASLVKAPSSSGAVADILCTGYAVYKLETVYNLTVGISLAPSGNIRIYDEEYNTTATGFASARKGVMLYYALATPTETEITDETLISQLNALQRAMSYDGGTSILQTNSDNPFAITYETSALTRPSKPTAEVTSMSTLPEVWSLQTADYISGYRFYTCLQIHYDNNTLTWTDVVEDKSLQDVREKIVTMSTDIIQNTEAINLKADSSTVEQGFNDMGDRIAQTEQANADLQVRANSISSSVSETRTLLETNYATKSELTNSVNSLSTTIQQTAQDIQLTITDVQEIISSQGSQITTLETYLRATSRGLEISRSNDEVTMVLGNSELGFFNRANVKLAWLNTDDGLGANALSIGDANTASNRWRVFTRESGSHLTFTRHS